MTAPCTFFQEWILSQFQVSLSISLCNELRKEKNKKTPKNPQKHRELPILPLVSTGCCRVLPPPPWNLPRKGRADGQTPQVSLSSNGCFECRSQVDADPSEFKCTVASRIAHSGSGRGGSGRCSCHNSTEPLRSLHLGAGTEDPAWSQLDALKEVRIKGENRLNISRYNPG